MNRKGLDFLRLNGELLRRTDLTAEAKLVLAALRVHLTSGNGRTPGVSLLSQELGLARRSVIRIIGRLERAGHLAVSRATGTRNLYQVETGDPTSPDTGDPTSPDTGDPTSPDTGDPTSPETGDPTSPSTKKTKEDLRRAKDKRRWLLSNFFREHPFPKTTAQRKAFLGFWAETFGSLDFEEECRLCAFLLQGEDKKNPAGWCVSVLTGPTWSVSDECLALAKVEMTQGAPVVAEAESLAVFMNGSAE